MTHAQTWNETQKDGLHVRTAGTFCDLDSVLSCFSQKQPDFSALENALQNEKLCFGLIVQTKNYTFALCDRVQSYPVFYDENRLSENMDDLCTSIEKENLDEAALLEFTMAGYCLGNRTLHKNIRQLQAGEWIYISGGQIKLHRYYTYAPRPVQNTDESYWHKKLGTVLDEAIQRTIQSCAGRPIVVPLSGGLDSRLILSKLHEHGAPDLQTFSYGLKANFEARMAEKIARQIGVPWQMVAAQPNKAVTLYQSKTRKQYTQYAHGFSRIPAYVEFESFHTLRRDKIIPENSVIINGQTGDFISGGHIPASLFDNENPDITDLHSYAIAKHFSLWKNLKSDKNLAKITNSVEKLLLPFDDTLSKKENLIRFYESFEWQERQCKTVVNAQKTYDYFGYEWRLPLWDLAVMDLFAAMPFALKYKQNLYKSYLKAYNYKGAFEEMSAKPVVWQPHQFWIVWAARLLGLTKGKKAKEDFYLKMHYYSDRHNQYALFGRDMYNAYYKDSRNIISLSILDFLQEQDIPIPAP